MSRSNKRFKLDAMYILLLSIILTIYIIFSYELLLLHPHNNPGGLSATRALPYIFIPLPVIALLIFFSWHILKRRIMKPIKEVAKAAENITHEDLNARVRIEGADEDTRYLAEAFNSMISRLENYFEYIVESSAYIAHELKTPLAIIRGESEVALKKERDIEEYKRVISINLDETRKMLKTIEDLLVLTKMNYRPEFLNFEQIELKQFIDDIYEQTKILASEENIIVNINNLKQPVNIKADKLHLRRLFFNIIDNAIKYNKKNGEINISAEYFNNKARVSISDNGIGIAEEHLPKLFDKFFRVDEEKYGSASGSGLGLPLAQSIAKIHNAEIIVKSEINKGSTFTVVLPT